MFYKQIYLNSNFDGGKTIFLDEKSWTQGNHSNRSLINLFIDKIKVNIDQITPTQGTAM